MTKCQPVLFASPVGAHNVPPDGWIYRICPLRLSACLRIHAVKHNNSLLIDSLQLTWGSNTHVNPSFSKVGLFLTVEHCRSAATADNMQSQGRLNPITGSPRNDIIPALEGRYDLEPITGWWGWRWGLGNVKTRPLWLCGINHGTRLWLWDEEQESYVNNGCLLFFCLISELASVTIKTVC